MTDLPDGWKWSTLGEECDLYQPKTISREKMITDGIYEVYGANGVIGRYNEYNHEDSEVLLSCRGNCGTVNVSKPTSWINGNAMVCRPKTSSLLKNYLRYYLESVNFTKVITGTAQQQITREPLSKVEIAIPSIAEQHRIVELLEDHLSRLDAALADVKQAKIKAAQFRRSLFESIFSGKLEDGSHVWSLTTIGEVSAKPQYGWTTSASNSGEVKLLRTTDLTRGPLNWETVPFCEELPSDTSRYLLAPGDILISRTGVGVGTSGLIESVPVASVFASYLIRIRPISTLKPKFLSYFLQSPEYWKQIGFLKAGSAISNINVPKIQSIKVPFPSLPIQEKVIEYVDLRLIELDHFSKVIDEAENKAIGLRRSLLQAAFTGQLTKEVVSV